MKNENQNPKATKKSKIEVMDPNAKPNIESWLDLFDITNYSVTRHNSTDMHVSLELFAQKI
jgi:hypothetical protein